MNKYIALLLLFVTIYFGSFGQDLAKFHLYDPSANAKTDISAAIHKAKKENKHVFIQIGGNWCIWCARFNQVVTGDSQLDSAMNADYIVYHLNYSKENKNREMLARFGYPQRFGFPVFVILGADGRPIHTQNSAYLEEGKGYNKQKILEFFDNWSVRALDPSQYKNF